MSKLHQFQIDFDIFLWYFRMNTGSRHADKYKNAGLDSAEMRRRREEEGIQLRKQKREQQLIKRRNVKDQPDDDDEDCQEMGQMLQDPADYNVSS